MVQVLNMHDRWSDADLETTAVQRQRASDKVDAFVPNPDDNALVKAMLGV